MYYQNKLQTFNVQPEWLLGHQKNLVKAYLFELIVNQYFKTLTLHDQQKGIHIYEYTEYFQKGITFGAYPNYKCQGPWYSYV